MKIKDITITEWEKGSICLECRGEVQMFAGDTGTEVFAACIIDEDETLALATELLSQHERLKKNRLG